MGYPSLTGEFSTTLIAAAALLNRMQMPWMCIGGAALALHGVRDGPVKDIDILLSAASARDLHQRFSWPNHADGTSSRFRSQYLLRPNLGPVPIELLGDFHIGDGEAWTSIDAIGAESMQLGPERIFLPSRKRLAEIFRLCGREKDLRRAALLENL